MEKYIIDRFEGEYAVLECEDGSTRDVLRSLILHGNEGDVVVFENGAYRTDIQETERRKEIIAEKMRKLFEKK